MIKELDISQFSEMYVTNRYRLDLWRYFLINILIDKNLNIEQFYVLGSFITAKVFPNDIDLIIPVNVVDEELHQYTQNLKKKYSDKLHIYWAYNEQEIDYNYLYSNVIKNPSITNHEIVRVIIGR